MKKIAYFILIVILIVLGFVIYLISASDTTMDINDKVKAEIFYFESKFIYIFNSLNNIEYQNYKISVEAINDKSKKLSESNSNNSSESNTDNSLDSNTSNLSENKTNKYSLNAKGILNNQNGINWEYIKNEAEMLESSVSTFTLDLYNINLNDNDILNFTKVFDNLLINIKKEDKEQCLKQLVILYSYIPKFIKNCNIDLQTEIVYFTKYCIFKAYSLLDTDKWDEVLDSLQEASDNFSKLLIDVNIQNKNQFVVNKCYILINELINAANIKEKDIFLIKYRNLLEDLNNI